MFIKKKKLDEDYIVFVKMNEVGLFVLIMIRFLKYKRVFICIYVNIYENCLEIY